MCKQGHTNHSSCFFKGELKLDRIVFAPSSLSFLSLPKTVVQSTRPTNPQRSVFDNLGGINALL